MTSFLQQVARKLIAEHGTALGDVAVVLPSQRAGLYLRKWLAEEAGAPLWSAPLGFYHWQLHGSVVRAAGIAFGRAGV